MQTTNSHQLEFLEDLVTEELFLFFTLKEYGSGRTYPHRYIYINGKTRNGHIRLPHLKICHTHPEKKFCTKPKSFDRV